MSVRTHFIALKRRHQALEEQICGELLHSSYDNLKLAELKRRKLLIKDEIAQLQRGVSPFVSDMKLPAVEGRTVRRTATLKSSSWYKGAVASMSIVKANPR
jgi:hypothetical protein